MATTITIIGSGNVATHLGKGLKNAGLKIEEVFSPDKRHALALAHHLKASVPATLAELSLKSDVYLLCVPDRYIQSISDKIPITQGIVAHTSGITPLAALKKHPEHGVFYPLQTFSKAREVTLKNIPFCLEASSENGYRQLSEIASLVSNTVKLVNSASRMQLHLAAVFVNNFVNYLYTVGADLTEENGLSFDLLIPLIEETASKIATLPPRMAQTGPARRNDQNTIALHRKLLKNYPQLQKLYNQISKRIISEYYE